MHGTWMSVDRRYGGFSGVWAALSSRSCSVSMPNSSIWRCTCACFRRIVALSWLLPGVLSSSSSLSLLLSALAATLGARALQGLRLQACLLWHGHHERGGSIAALHVLFAL